MPQTENHNLVVALAGPLQLAGQTSFNNNCAGGGTVEEQRTNKGWRSFLECFIKVIAIFIHLVFLFGIFLFKILDFVFTAATVIPEEKKMKVAIVKNLSADETANEGGEPSNVNPAGRYSGLIFNLSFSTNKMDREEVLDVAAIEVDALGTEVEEKMVQAIMPSRGGDASNDIKLLSIAGPLPKKSQFGYGYTVNKDDEMLDSISLVVDGARNAKGSFLKEYESHQAQKQSGNKGFRKVWNEHETLSSVENRNFHQELDCYMEDIGLKQLNTSLDDHLMMHCINGEYAIDLQPYQIKNISKLVGKNLGEHVNWDHLENFFQ